MNWDAIGAIGELIGAVAVVASLIYIANQTKANVRALENSSSAQQSSMFIDIVRPSYENPELASWLAKLQRTESLKSLTPEEMTRSIAFFVAALKASEHNFHQWLSGRLPENEWESTTNSIRNYILAYPILREFWSKGLGSNLSSDYASFLTQIIEDTRGLRKGEIPYTRES